jgi:hypothetical protein
MGRMHFSARRPKVRRRDAGRNAPAIGHWITCSRGRPVALAIRFAISTDGLNRPSSIEQRWLIETPSTSDASQSFKRLLMRQVRRGCSGSDFLFMPHAYHKKFRRSSKKSY